MTKADPCRFCWIYALAVVGFAALIGAVMAVMVVMAAFGPRLFGDADSVMRLIILSGLSSLGPAITGSALLVAFVVWAHPLPLPQIQAELPRYIKRGMLLSLPGYVLAQAFLLGVALLIAHLAFEVSWAAGGEALSFIGPGAWAAGALSALVDAGLVAFLAWRYLARLQAGKSSLAMKLVLAWTFATGLRMTVGVVISLFLSA